MAARLRSYPAAKQSNPIQAQSVDGRIPAEHSVPTSVRRTKLRRNTVRKRCSYIAELTPDTAVRNAALAQAQLSDSPSQQHNAKMVSASGWHGCTLPKRNHFTHYCVSSFAGSRIPLLPGGIGYIVARAEHHARRNGRTDNPPPRSGPIARVHQQEVLRVDSSPFVRYPRPPSCRRHPRAEPISGLILFLLHKVQQHTSARPRPNPERNHAAAEMPSVCGCRNLSAATAPPTARGRW